MRFLALLLLAVGPAPRSRGSGWNRMPARSGSRSTWRMSWGIRRRRARLPELELCGRGRAPATGGVVHAL